MTSYGKKLRIVYLGALVCIATLSVASHLYLHSLEETLVSDSPVMNVAGAQRMLSQRISSMSQQLYYELARGDYETAADRATELRDSIDSWSAAHRALVSRRGAMGLEGTNSFEVAKLLSLLDAYIESTSQASMTLFDASANPAQFSGEAATASVATIVQVTEHFLSSMNNVVDAYEAESMSKVERLQTVELITTYLGLALLAFLAFAVFEPAIRTLARQESDLLALRSAIDTHTIFSATDSRGRIIDVNDGFCDISGYSRDELVGATHAILKSGEHSREFWADMWNTIQSGETWRGEICNQSKDGTLFWIDSTDIPQFDAAGNIERFISLRFDITEKKQAEARLDMALSASSTGLWDCNLETGKDYFNHVVLEILGYEPNELELSIQSWKQLCHPEDLPKVSAALDEHLVGRTQTYSCEYRVRKKDGGYTWIRDVGQVVERDEQGVAKRIVGVYIDIQALRDALGEAERSHSDLEESQQRFELAIEGSRDAIFDWDLGNDQVWFSRRWLQLLKIGDAQLGSSIPDLLWHVAPEDSERLRAELSEFVESDQQRFESEFQLVDGKDQAVWVMMRAVSFRDDTGQAMRVAGSVADISSIKEAQAAMQRLIQQDHLTGLASRARLTERLDHAVKRCKRNGNYCGVLFFDFDRFKVVNDSLGHDVGDELLCSIAERLRSNVREVDTPARFGGDEFVILLEDMDEPQRARLVADKLLKICAAPHQIRGHSLVSTASIGLVTSNHEGSNPSDLLRYADAAMYEAKRKGRDCVVEFDQAMFDAQQQSAELEEELQSAIECDQLQLHYQPVIDLQTGTISSAEALLRWNHPTKGFIPPGEFISIAEESKQIIAIGEWVIVEACRQLVDWRDRGIVSEDFAVSVNASKVQLLTPGFEKMLVDHVDSFGLPRNVLKIEVTETTIVDNRSDIGNVLRSLRDQSIVIMMDDFGTGHSSLSVLHNLPVDELKIDQSFIRHADKSRDLVAITSSIVTLAEHLSLKTIGEGIEGQEHVALLQTLGCTYGQGYFWSRPVPAAEAEKLFHGTETIKPARTA